MRSDRVSKERLEEKFMTNGSALYTAQYPAT